jgi:hypothetical protein
MRATDFEKVDFDVALSFGWVMFAMGVAFTVAISWLVGR